MIMNSIHLSYSNIRKVALAYLLTPLILFLFFFAKKIISVPVIIAILYTYCKAVSNPMKEDRQINFSPMRLILFCAIILIWCVLGGQGGFFPQTTDWNERNAIFRDLITNEWPVYYSVTDTYLTYYIGHWLPAAFMARIVYGVTGSLNVSWFTGNILLMVWTTLGVLTAFILSLIYINAQNAKIQWGMLAIFIGFSGPDVVGCLVKGWKLIDFFEILHLEWWIGIFQFSSNTTCLFWVFNQAVTAWVAIMIYLNEEDNKAYALVVVCALVSSPLPCVGLALYMICSVFQKGIAALLSGRLLKYLKSTFCITNILPTISALPILALYYMSNSAVENTDSSQTPLMLSYMIPVILRIGLLLLGTQFILRIKKKQQVIPTAVFLPLILAVLIIYYPENRDDYILFLSLEVGVYILALLVNYARSELYFPTAVIFMIAPQIKIGTGADFCMRASIPAVMVLMMMCVQSLKRWSFETNNRKKIHWRLAIPNIIIIATLLIGIATPAMEIYRTIHSAIEMEHGEWSADAIYTLNQYHSSGGIYGNFVSATYRDSLYFKYIAPIN